MQAILINPFFVNWSYRGYELKASDSLLLTLLWQSLWNQFKCWANLLSLIFCIPCYALIDWKALPQVQSLILIGYCFTFYSVIINVNDQFVLINKNDFISSLSTCYSEETFITSALGFVVSTILPSLRRKIPCQSHQNTLRNLIKNFQMELPLVFIDFLYLTSCIWIWSFPALSICFF